MDSPTSAPNSDSPQEHITVPVELSGLRLDAALAKLFPDHSRSMLQSCILQERVSVNSHPCLDKSTKVSAGDVLDILWPLPQDTVPHAEDIPLDILFEDEHIIVINKPAGLVVHPAHGNTTGTLVHGLLFHDSAAFEEMLDDSNRPGIVHRLDKDTSGVLIIAKTPQARDTLKQTFQLHDLEKVYLTIALGTFQEKRGTISAPIGRHPVNKLRMAIDKVHGKDATSLYQVIAEANGCSLVKVKILTGRTHQIRVHLSSIGHPVLGDPLYGGTRKNAPIHPDRQLLHAWKLSIPHPATGERLSFHAPIPDDFIDALNALNLPFSDQP